MIKRPLLYSCLGSLLLATAAFAATAPKPYGAIPTDDQVKWQRMEYYAFVHLGLNTVTDKEWGYGDEDPTKLNPASLNTDEITRLFKDAGMKGVILTAKHHDGFCLWPTKSTQHNITKSPWKNGKGDMVFDFAKSANKNGIKFGVYISPWDRNHAEYAREGYLTSYYQQIKELLNKKKYGPIFEIWFDGANGGDGFYGGARETRKMPPNYYNFPKIVSMIRQLQPRCIIWGAGAYGDARWGGSEQGHVNYPHWPTISHNTGENVAGTGIRGGERWVPAEGDTSIRHGWFWHESANHTVKSPEKLLQLWFDCVGRGANLILNVPPDKQGIIYHADKNSLLEFKKLRDRLYAQDFALGAQATAKEVRGNDTKQFGPQNLVDDNIESYWAPNDNSTTGEIELTLKKPATFDVVRVREQIRLGQRVDEFALDAFEKGEWKEVLKGSSIGNQAMLKLPSPVTTDKVRLRITKAAACPTISELSLLRQPIVLSAPAINRDKDGMVTLKASAGGNIHYTTDGSDPTISSPVYTAPFNLKQGGVVKAVVADGKEVGSLATAQLSFAKNKWKVIDAPANTAGQAAIDENPSSFWHTHPTSGELAPPQSLTVDMGEPLDIRGFTYLPRQDGTTHGMTDKYTFEVSTDNKTWTKVAEGEFSNLRANPIEHAVSFDKPVSCRYFRFTGTHALDKNHISAAEIGVLLAK